MEWLREEEDRHGEDYYSAPEKSWYAAQALVAQQTIKRTRRKLKEIELLNPTLDNPGEGGL